jgi:hypothetical protein
MNTFQYPIFQACSIPFVLSLSNRDANGVNFCHVCTCLYNIIRVLQISELNAAICILKI